MNHNIANNRSFLTWFILAMIGASLWIFKSYLHFLLVAAVLSLSTSYILNALTHLITSSNKKGLIHQNKDTISALILTIGFLMIVFLPLVYFVSVTYGQIENLDIAQIKTYWKYRVGINGLKLAQVSGKIKIHAPKVFNIKFVAFLIQQKYASFF